MQFKPYDYQKHAIDHIIKNLYCGLFLDMGLGKTVSTLSAISYLMYEELEVDKVLVIAPLRVADATWDAEIKKWDHLKHLRYSKVLGSAAKRKAALKTKADIYIINRENVSWLVGYYGTAFPFDMVVIDELSSFKSPKAQRFKALKMVRPIVNRVVGLTGTPSPNSLIDLWSQLYLLDMGERLGKFIGHYRSNYFNPGQTNGHVVFNYKLKKQSEERIYEKISDICISMKARDYLNLPERIDRTVDVVLSNKDQKSYTDFEKKMVLQFMDEEEISVANAAGLSNKLLQYANGAVYNEDRVVRDIHNEKLNTLEEIVDCANGKPILVFYSFKHDYDRIMKQLKKYKPKKLETSKDIEEWNKGNIRLLLAHPASCGHGLNLQAGGHIIVWFGLTWSLELYQQANARLDRQGQKQNVIIHHLVTKGTIDEDVLLALENKATGQDALMEAVKARVKKYRKAD
ncbi:DEAD/DEAH box helicase [Vallitalea sp.]|jgi:SNF2 family DNA or RNA helicase|uniref:DEAD/DEAH box helicase n=1 Tax=Vallitalea sp. TaxID=1882829 RepID=UPI0025CDCE39|nr:DEAD/DEAH box helicase [Vallitalea sp.]MCT4686067.1 DEAD/DEAH box helicase [Vallitalea sp.]